MRCSSFYTQQQGAFAEHSSCLSRLGADVREVRLPHEFDGLDGIVLPGIYSLREGVFLFVVP